MSAFIRNMSIRRRLMMIVIGINLVTLVVIGLVSVSSYQQSLVSQARERFAEKNQQAVRAIENDLRTVVDTTRQLELALSTASSYSQAQLRSIIRGVITQDNDDLIQRVLVYRPAVEGTEESDDSVVVYQDFISGFGPSNTIRTYSLDNQQPDPSAQMFVSMNNDQPTWFVQSVAFADGNDLGAVSFAVPYNYDDVATGVLWVDIPQPRFDLMFTDELNQIALLSDTSRGYAVLVDQDGHVVTGQGGRAEEVTSSTINTILSRIDPQEITTDNLHVVNSPLTNAPIFVSVERLSVNDWLLVSVFPSNDIPLSSGLLEFQILIIAVTGITVMIVAINYFSRTSIVEPLLNLSRGAQEIGSGDMRYYIDYREFDDEIGDLARAMETMKGNIAHSYDELRTWSRTLEERVYERTVELNQTRQEAEAIANDLRAVYDESLMVVNEPTLEPILDALVQRILGLLNASYCSIWLLDDSRQFIRLVSNSEDADVEEFFIPVGSGMVGQSIRQQSVVTIDDYMEYEHRVMLPYQSTAPYVRAMVAPLMFDGTPLGAVVVGRDVDGAPFNEGEIRLLTLFSNLVSPAVRNAQLFNQREEARRDAERANQVKTRFLASVTHELRTPLNLIINNMDFMRIGAFGDVNDEQISRLNQTVRSAEHLLYLINDLLDVSKIEAGEMQLFIQPNDIYTIIEDSIDTTHAFMEKLDDKEKHVDLIVDVEKDLPKIPMDARRIRQVLTNLLSNAVKFTPQGSVTLTVKGQEHGIYFAVTDTGIGIPQNEIGVLFEAFERTTQAKERAIEGTGLGLPISQYLVQQHGGVLEVESQDGHGTTFQFTLPYVTPTSSSDSQNVMSALKPNH